MLLPLRCQLVTYVGQIETAPETLAHRYSASVKVFRKKETAAALQCLRKRYSEVFLRSADFRGTINRFRWHARMQDYACNAPDKC